MIFFVRAIVLCLAVVGAIYVSRLAPRVLMTLFPSFAEVGVKDAGVKEAIYSPDGKFKAVLFNENGGGAISPYCFDFISVAPASMPDAATNRDSYRVYSAGCHSLGFVHSPGEPPFLVGAPLVRWNSNSVLEITFDPTMAASGIKEFILRGWDVAGQIRVVHRQFVESKR